MDTQTTERPYHGTRLCEKGGNFWSVQQSRWISNTWCWVKEIRHERGHKIWFSSYKTRKRSLMGGNRKQTRGSPRVRTGCAAWEQAMGNRLGYQKCSTKWSWQPQGSVHSSKLKLYNENGCIILCKTYLTMCAKLLQLLLHGPSCVRLLCPWDSPRKSTGVGCHALL